MEGVYRRGDYAFHEGEFGISGLHRRNWVFENRVGRLTPIMLVSVVAILVCIALIARLFGFGRSAFVALLDQLRTACCGQALLSSTQIPSCEFSWSLGMLRCCLRTSSRAVVCFLGCVLAGFSVFF